MELKEALQLEISEDQMCAYLHVLNFEVFNQLLEQNTNFKHDLTELLQGYGIQYGIRLGVIEEILEDPSQVNFPVLIAEGDLVKDGIDGSVDFKVEHSVRMELDEQDDIDFKNVIKIPMVDPGELIAVILDPIKGKVGKNVYGTTIQPKEGKAVQIKAGENTSEVEEQKCIYATNFGQVSLINDELKVLPLYEVSNTLDLTTGNIDFNGSVLIRGDVPEGFNVNAKGDVTIHGLVEGANVTAGGSIYVKEGISAVGKGFIQAGVDLVTHHINQGRVFAGRYIKVEQSIVHSEVTAKDSIYCQKGHIIGGTISSGSFIVCRDIGNRMHTLTQVFLGENNYDRTQRLKTVQQIKQLGDELFKLKALGDALNKKTSLNPKEKLTLEKQNQLLNEKKYRLDELLQQQRHLQKENDQKQFMKLLIHGMLYPNVEVTVGKYSKRFNSGYKQVSVLFDENDFKIEAI
ncbi:DUF342 domain-containing protein [Piscibacillus sp. B03]|uniref:DUF342 domain-containing protein n=1 Tax=Piscibacillus sp. B03 TaxID=3457430 RepID=UPI003FCE1615